MNMQERLSAFVAELAARGHQPTVQVRGTMAEVIGLPCGPVRVWGDPPEDPDKGSTQMAQVLAILDAS